MKVLIISHNPISPVNNMGKTLLSLFSEFKQEELCQLYIYPTLPNCRRCSSYYRITDKDVLSALLRRKKVGGEIDPALIRETEGMYENAADQSLYKNRKNKSALRRLLRDAMWDLVNWYSRDLEAWLEREKPECIFVAPGAAKFIYNFALKISKSRGIPIITYICDEYYFVKQPKELLDRLRLRLLKAKMRALMEKTSHLVCISEELKAEYSKEFGVESTVLMTGAASPIADVPQVVAEPQEICYFGNIRCNRYLSLRDIGRELDTINASEGKNYTLKIRTMEQEPEILNCLREIRSIRMCDFVTGEAFDKALHEAELLLHVEAFDEESVDLVRNSVSTKVADSLASGIPLLAYGPEKVSSMKHLLRHECAVAATSRDDLRRMLMTAFSDETARKQAAENGLAVARGYHDSRNTSAKLKEIVGRIV